MSMESSSFHQQSNVNERVQGLGKVHQLCWQGFPSHSLLGSTTWARKVLVRPKSDANAVMVKKRSQYVNQFSPKTYLPISVFSRKVVLNIWETKAFINATRSGPKNNEAQLSIPQEQFWCRFLNRLTFFVEFLFSERIMFYSSIYFFAATIKISAIAC